MLTFNQAVGTARCRVCFTRKLLIQTEVLHKLMKKVENKGFDLQVDSTCKSLALLSEAILAN